LSHERSGLSRSVLPKNCVMGFWSMQTMLTATMCLGEMRKEKRGGCNRGHRASLDFRKAHSLPASEAERVPMPWEPDRQTAQA
jgi:hypothetical protein